MFDWEPLWLTLRLAAVTTACLLALGVPLAYTLAFGRWRGKIIAEVLVSMPLVLPPTVIGFYLLLLFSPANSLGRWLQAQGIHLAFSFPGLVLASIVYSLPFMVQPILSGFRSLPESLTEAAQTLGKSPWQILKNVQLPNIRPALLTGAVLTFAHTIGEFGVVLMIGGNIPGKTRVASIQVYDEVEAMNYDSAHQYAAILFVISFVILLAVYLTNRLQAQGRWMDIVNWKK